MLEEFKLRPAGNKKLGKCWGGHRQQHQQIIVQQLRSDDFLLSILA